MRPVFKFSQRSLDRLEEDGMDPRLISVVKEALTHSRVDFGVTEGLRTLEKQKQYVEDGKSHTLSSKHLEGKAVDLVGYSGGTVCWEFPVYAKIATAMKIAAYNQNCKIRWGGAWHIEDLANWDEGTMLEAHTRYVDLRRSQHRVPFTDGPHFELMD